MKKIIAAWLVMLILMLSACGQDTDRTEAAKRNDNPSAIAVDETIQGSNEATGAEAITGSSEETTAPAEPVIVREEGTHSNITITIPGGWNHEVWHGDQEDEYGISFWPEGRDDGKLALRHLISYGVCGTGLRVQEITVGNYRAEKGTYDNHMIWSYIYFMDISDSYVYVVINEGAEKWWGQYGREAMQILDTVILAEGITTTDKRSG